MKCVARYKLKCYIDWKRSFHLSVKRMTSLNTNEVRCLVCILIETSDELSNISDIVYPRTHTQTHTFVQFCYF